MRWFAMFALVVVLGTIPTRAQAPPTGSPGRSPRDVVEELWNMATEGELLTPDGWHRVSHLYESPRPWPGNSVVRVVTNGWGSNQRSIKGKTAEVEVWYGAEVGHIDSALRFTPSKVPPHDVEGFRLVFVPTHILMFGPDGRTLIEDRPGPEEWKIEGPPGPPWTTVNTAIRYVLEKQKKTSDPTVKKNADKTLAELMIRH